MEGQENSQVGVVMVPFPAQCHLNQLLQLSHLIPSYGIPVHYAGSATHNRQVQLRDLDCPKQTLTSNPQIKFHDFQLPPYSTPPPNPNFKGPLHLRPLRLATSYLRQPIFELFKELATKYRRVIVIYDTMMAHVVQDVKLIPNVQVYTFHYVSVFFLFFDEWESIDEKPFQLEADDASRYIPFKEGYGTTTEYSDFIASQRKLSLELASGRIYNSSRLIEGKYIESYQKLPMNARMKHFPLGPFIRAERSLDHGNRHVCLKWLDKQERNSVILVSFGTTTTLTNEQISELASGLEKSGQKFLWLLRCADRGDIFAQGDEKDHVPQLPEGYEERVRNRGLILTEWTPQLDILAHPSTGGFMSHCGWASCLESISMGVPIAAWPMAADQPKNAVLVTDVFLRVGILVRDWEDKAKLIKSNTIENVVRRLMASEEGEEVRNRATLLGCSVRESFTERDSKSSDLDSFIAHITAGGT